MALTARLNLRQSQSLAMTPQLLQSIRLLQFSRAELERFVDDQIERNPLLQRADEQGSADVDPVPDTDTGPPVSARAMADELDTSLENVFPDDPGRADGTPVPPTGTRFDRQLRLPSSAPSESDWSPDDLAAGGPTLREFVLGQIVLAVRDPSDRAIAFELADRLDERGYLDGDLARISHRLGVPEADVERVLVVLQTLEPAGLFARDLAECLALQCARRDRLDPAMDALLAHLDLLARRDFKTLKQLCGVNETDLLDMLDEIRGLDPRPGMAYQAGPVEAVMHDVEVRARGDGSWQIELNNDALPRILVDQQYYATVTKGKLTGDEKAFMTQSLQDANWLERSLDQRATTILKVATEIVRQQDRFFAEGVSGLKPLTMKMVADEISMHESTVSRVAANKYLMTPRGLFEFRFFFTGAIAGTTGSDGDHASESVRQRIRDLIEAESSNQVLSDDALVGLLRREGVDIARRTVAKYRESMNIASSVQRRREKRALALART